MKKVLSLFVLIITFAFVVSPALAQYDPCEIPPGYYRTQSQGGWGQDACNGGNVACFRNAWFDFAFPGDLVVGGTFTITLNSSADVANYLNEGGSSGPLTQNHLNPSSTEAGNFGGQVTALALTLGFAAAGVPGMGDIGSLIVPEGVDTPAGAFAGWTVQEIFDLASDVLGGNLAALPSGISLQELNTVVDNINNTFVDGTTSSGYLVEEGCDEILPVELASFDAFPRENEILIRWVTHAETNIDYYALHRSTDGQNWNRIASLNSLGNSASGHTYTFTDNDVNAGATYIYRLSIQELSGAMSVYPNTVSASPQGSSVPGQFSLEQNYPNPFNPSTTIRFSVPEAMNATLIIYDALGREVAVLANGTVNAGEHAVEFDASNLSSGIYLYKLTSDNFSATRKLVLMK